MVVRKLVKERSQVTQIICHGLEFKYYLVGSGEPLKNLSKVIM